MTTDDTPDRPARRRHLLRLAAFAVFLAALFYLFTVLRVVDVDEVRGVIAATGPAAPLTYVVGSALLGALFVPGPILAAGSGVLFGPLLGTVVTLGATVGTAAVAGLVGRRAGRESARELLGAQRADRIDGLIQRRGLWAVVGQRFVPGISDALASYAFGAFGVPLWQLVVGALIGSLPRAFVYTALGAAVGDPSSPLMYTAIGVWCVTAVIGVVAARQGYRRWRRGDATPGGNGMWVRRRRRPVPVGMFDPAVGEWRDVDEPAPPVERDALTVTTFNIWFDEYHAEQRYLAMSRLLSTHRPDIMVFQEVTPAALEVFLAQPWIRAGYRRAAVVGPGVGNYGMLLLSRLPLTDVSYTGLPTRLSRGFLRAHCIVNGSPLAICSVHLDSGKQSASLRARQLRRVFRALRRVDDAVVLGDFNMRDAENHRITTRFTDAWPALRPGEDGFTEDTDINLMRWDSKPKHRQVRFDRVLVKGRRWAAAEIELLGTESVSPALPRVFPSDHFGVRCRLSPGDGGRGPRLHDRRKGVWWARFRSSP